MAEITSVVITREANNIWTYQDNTMPVGKPMAASYYDGIIKGDLVNFLTDNGGILYNGIRYDIISYIDSIDSGNNFTPTSAVALIVNLKGQGFFDNGNTGSSSDIALEELSNSYLGTLLGRGGQLLYILDNELGFSSKSVVIPQNFQDLLNVPDTLIPGSIFKVDPSGLAIIQVDPTVLTDAPIEFKERKWISKGYRWLTVEGVLQPVANTQNIQQVGAIVRGWVSDDPDTIDATWYWMNAGRYKGGDKRLKDSYQLADYNLLAFTTDPDY